MSDPPSRPGFAARPGDAESWIKASDAPAPRKDAAAIYSARLTIDVTPALRSRIKLAAFRRGVTVADILRGLLACEFPDKPGDTS